MFGDVAVAGMGKDINSAIAEGAGAVEGITGASMASLRVSFKNIVREYLACMPGCVCLKSTVFPRLGAWVSISRLCVACPESKGAEASI